MTSVKAVNKATPPPPETSHDTYVVDLNKQLLQQVQSLAYENGMLKPNSIKENKSLKSARKKFYCLQIANETDGLDSAIGF
jgi:hypothetical protein